MYPYDKVINILNLNDKSCSTLQNRLCIIFFLLCFRLSFFCFLEMISFSSFKLCMCVSVCVFRFNFVCWLNFSISFILFCLFSFSLLFSFFLSIIWVLHGCLLWMVCCHICSWEEALSIANFTVPPVLIRSIGNCDYITPSKIEFAGFLWHKIV